jgi:hypothetical protein
MVRVELPLRVREPAELGRLTAIGFKRCRWEAPEERVPGFCRCKKRKEPPAFRHGLLSASVEAMGQRVHALPRNAKNWRVKARLALVWVRFGYDATTAIQRAPSCSATAFTD